MPITSRGKLFFFFLKKSKKNSNFSCSCYVVFGNSIFWRVGSKNRAVYFVTCDLIGLLVCLISSRTVLHKLLST